MHTPTFPAIVASTAIRRMPRSTSPVSRRIATAFAAIALLSGCAANFSAQTQVLYQPGVGSDSRSSDVYVINALVVADTSGNGTFVTSMINQSGDTDYLVSVTAVDPTGGAVAISQLPTVDNLSQSGGSGAAPTRGVALPSQSAAKFPDDGLVQLTAKTVSPGTFVKMTFTFQNAAPVTMDVPVVAEDPIYQGITVGPIKSTASPSATPSQ